MSRPGRAFVALGGNLGDPRAAMQGALDLLDADYDTDILRVSSLYRTPPWGVTDQPDFLNAVAEVATAREPHSLLELCLTTEQALHRVRAERWGPRTIDLDLLAYDDVEMSDTELILPHPRLTERAFVLVPLAEIAPDLSIRGLPVAEWLALADTSGIVRAAGPEWWHNR